VIKRRRMRWMGHLARMGERIDNSDFVVIPERKRKNWKNLA
jgi:hypothetical protein